LFVPLWYWLDGSASSADVEENAKIIKVRKLGRELTFEHKVPGVKTKNKFLR
jgi:hypothetical protein